MLATIELPQQLAQPVVIAGPQEAVADAHGGGHDRSRHLLLERQDAGEVFILGLDLQIEDVLGEAQRLGQQLFESLRRR